MYPSKHIVFGLIFSLLAYFTFPQIGTLGFFTIWFASFLIDVDHYIFYVFTSRDLSLIQSHKWFMKESAKSLSLSKKDRKKFSKQIPCVFHGIEAIAILFLLSFVNILFLYVLIGFIFHEILDFIHIVYYGYSLKHIGSQTYNLLTYLRK